MRVSINKKFILVYIIKFDLSGGRNVISIQCESKGRIQGKDVLLIEFPPIFD